MKRLLPIVLLALAACDPKPAELDGAPVAPDSSDLDGGPAAPPPAANLLLPGVIDLATPPTMQVVENCETIIAADYESPPKTVCLLFSEADTLGAAIYAPFQQAMSAANWAFIRTQCELHYFERLRPSGSCADVAAISMVTDRLNLLVDHVGKQSGPLAMLPTHTSWYAYAIPVSTHMACGADRMKP